MKKEVIIMGNVNLKLHMFKYPTEKLQIIRSMYDTIPTNPEIVIEEKFVDYAEITRSNQINSNLKVGDLIYLSEDNDNFPIEQVSVDTEGNTVYFINKVVAVIEDERTLEANIKAQRELKWFEEYEAEQAKELERELKLEKQKEMVEKEVSKMDRWWKSNRKHIKY